MPRLLKLAAILGLLVFLLTSWVIFRMTAGTSGARAAWPDSGDLSAADLPAEAVLSVPEFTLTDHRGNAFTRDNLRGRITIVNFVFTNCPFVCPTLMEKMVGLSIALKNEPVHFVSISVDPAHDTPQALAEFAKLHGADKDNWSLLTGEKAEIDRIITGGLKFALTDDVSNSIKLPDGSTMNNIFHPSWFVLLGPEVDVKSLYRPDDQVNMQVLLNDVRRLAKELPRP
jgi:protein SCO1/2